MRSARTEDEQRVWDAERRQILVDRGVDPDSDFDPLDPCMSCGGTDGEHTKNCYFA